MRPLRNILLKIINWLDRRANQDQPSCEAVPAGYGNISKLSNTISSGSSGAMGHGMNFSVFSAVGGKVIRFHAYDARSDREIFTLYVVTDKEDLGEEIGQIITKESLSR